MNPDNRDITKIWEPIFDAALSLGVVSCIPGTYAGKLPAQCYRFGTEELADAFMLKCLAINGLPPMLLFKASGIIVSVRFPEGYKAAQWEQEKTIQ